MKPIDPNQHETTTFMTPRDFPVTVKADPIGLILSVRGGEAFNVVISWRQIEEAQRKAENPFRGMTAEQALREVTE